MQPSRGGVYSSGPGNDEYTHTGGLLRINRETSASTAPYVLRRRYVINDRAPWTTVLRLVLKSQSNPNEFKGQEVVSKSGITDFVDVAGFTATRVVKSIVVPQAPSEASEIARHKSTAVQESRRAESEKGKADESLKSATSARALAVGSKVKVDNSKEEVQKAGASLERVNISAQAADRAVQQANSAVSEAQAAATRASQASDEAKRALSAANAATIATVALEQANKVISEANKAANAAKDAENAKVIAERAATSAMQAVVDADKEEKAAKAASSPGRVLGCQIGSDIARSYTLLDSTDPCESPLLPTEYCKAKACESNAGVSFRRKKTCTNGRLVDDTSDKASCTLVEPNTPQTSGRAGAIVQGPVVGAGVGGPETAGLGFCLVNPDITNDYTLLDYPNQSCAGTLSPRSYCKAKTCEQGTEGLFRKRLICIDGALVPDTSDKASCTPVIPAGGGNGNGNGVTPANSLSQTTIACTALKDLPSSQSQALSNEDKPSSCSSIGSGVDVTVRRGTDTVRVTLYDRTKWEGYGLVAQATPATAGLKGVYVYVSKPLPVPLSVTCVWHEHDDGYVKGVYMANLTGLSDTLYTYTLVPTRTVPVTIEVPKEAVGPFAPTQEQINAVACAALGSKFTGEELQCTPPVGARADVAIVTVTKSGFTAQFNLYKYTQPASFWAGYGRAGVANSGAPTGVYVKISSTGDVTCVWDSGASGQKVEYKSERVPSASTSTSVYTLTSGTDNVTLVHDSGPSPFPPLTPKEAAEHKQKGAELAETTADACNELKKKLDWVVCDSTGPLTSDVMVTRGTAAGVLVTLHYDVPSKSWAGYGLSTGSAGTGPKGLYVAVSTDAQGAAVVKCVWDTNPTEVGEYRAVQDRTARMYTLVDPTSVVNEPVSVLVRSVQSPFPSERETPKPVAPAPAPSSLSTEAIIGIVVGCVAGFILIVVLVVLWVRSRKKAPFIPKFDELMDNFRFPQ